MDQINLKAIVAQMFLAPHAVLLEHWNSNAPEKSEESLPAQVSALNSFLRLQLCAIETVNTEQARASLIETPNATEWLESFKYNVLPVLIDQ